MTLVKRTRTIAAKVEGTPGTLESLTASEGSFNAYDIDLQGDIPVEMREGQGSMDYLQGVAGPRKGKMSFKVDLGWDGTTTMPTWASVLLPACGIVESSQVYTPRSEPPGTNVKTLTLALYQGPGRRKLLAGAVGNVVFEFPTGRMATAKFDFEGVWQPPTDTAIIAPTYPTAKPLRFGNATLTYAGNNLKTEMLSFDVGNVLKLLEDPSTAAGFCYGLVTNRMSKVTANPFSELIAGRDDYGDWIADTEAALAITIPGPAGGTSDADITFSLPKSQVMNVQESDRDGVMVEDIEYHANKNGANLDQNFSITFTEAVA